MGVHSPKGAAEQWWTTGKNDKRGTCRAALQVLRRLPFQTNQRCLLDQADTAGQPAHLPSRICRYCASWCSASRSLLWLSGLACSRSSATGLNGPQSLKPQPFPARLLRMGKPEGASEAAGLLGMHGNAERLRSLLFVVSPLRRPCGSWKADSSFAKHKDTGRPLTGLLNMCVREVQANSGVGVGLIRTCLGRTRPGSSAWLILLELQCAAEMQPKSHICSRSRTP